MEQSEQGFVFLVAFDNHYCVNMVKSVSITYTYGRELLFVPSVLSFGVPCRFVDL